MSRHQVPVEVSARHVHLSQVHLAELFGAGADLQVKKIISQPNQFAAQETVTVQGPKSSLICRVVGPVRGETQVELAASECRMIGVESVMRVSGTLDGTPGAKLIGPRGNVIIEKGVIVAQRHLHVSPEQAQKFGLKHGDVISVNTEGTRPVTFHDVFVRSRESIDDLSFMIDTDEADAAGLIGGEQGVVIF